MTSDYRSAICSELQKMEEDMLYTEKAHFAAAEELTRVHLCAGLIATVASAASVASIVAHGPAVIPGILSLIAAVASAIVTFVKPEKKAEQHLAAARSLGNLRLKARQHREIDLHTGSPEDVKVWRGFVERIAEAVICHGDGTTELPGGWDHRSSSSMRVGVGGVNRPVRVSGDAGRTRLR